MEDLVAIARISKPRALRGGVIADVLTDFPERFETLRDVIGLFQSGERIELKIEKFFFQKGRIVLKFTEYDSIEAAEGLRNLEICIPETDAAALDEDEFFDWQLIGCEVETIKDGPIGTVRDIMRTGGTEILVVKGEVKEYMIPFAEAICTEVDVDRKTIRVDPPEGLLDF